MISALSAAKQVYATLPTYAQTSNSQLSFRQPNVNSWFSGSTSKSTNLFEQYTKSMASGIASFLTSANNAKTAANSLGNKDSSALASRKASINDSTSLSATVSAGASINKYKVDVSAVAKSQINSGASLTKSAPSVMQSGSNQFELTIGNKTHKLSAFITNDDTNESSLTKMKDAINKANTGVTASIVTDEQTGTSKLQLKSDKTGTDQQFSLRDLTGNAVAATGINQVDTAASNTSYRVNGGAVLSSQSNTIDLEKGKVSVTLLKPTEEAVTVGVSADTDKIVSDVKKLISSYNEMNSRLNETSGYMNSQIKRGINNAVGSVAFSDIGIRKSADGSLQLDETKLKQSLNSSFDRTNATLTGTAGLATKLDKALDHYSEVPASSLLNKKAQAFQMYGTYQSSLQSTYSPYTMNGLLVNKMF
ncbi:MAG: flagellar filament capping protein FliD [Candidatus Cohnella colombiensis]|uniref:Flagellar filament capping protein FliD n=1 Tax=Candidatus Cohnella colombiensis TaxID=3121368 RepID=A0AA95JF97_9BACL|nr:MAG: flagellar filament capping protein FliD [Cohnella sp.]